MNDIEWRRSVEQRFREMNQKLKPSKRGGTGGGGSGGAGLVSQFWEIKESKAELSLAVDRWVLGLVQNDGATAEDGRRYYLNADGSAWVCWTHLE